MNTANTASSASSGNIMRSTTPQELYIPEGSVAQWRRGRLHFSFVARTSRSTMRVKDTYYICVTTPDGRTVYAEVPLFAGLSAEGLTPAAIPAFEAALSDACADPSRALQAGATTERNSDSDTRQTLFSAIAFGLESAAMALGALPDTPWHRGETSIPINGLIWMGSKDIMRKRIAEKLDAGFRVLKLKIGGIDFDDEIDLLTHIRRHFPAAELELRLDANGSFTADTALERLDRLAEFEIHSIEQPIRAGQLDAMADICRRSPIAIALDEELIGVRDTKAKLALLEYIKPQYIILKPALCGGFRAASEYAALAGDGHWWATSALESNLGLYAIARWLDGLCPQRVTEGELSSQFSMPQGLGTGQLYTDNIPSPLTMHSAGLWYRPDVPWQTEKFFSEWV